MTDTTPTPKPLPLEQCRPYAREEALDAVMYLATEYASLRGDYAPGTPTIEWLAELGRCGALMQGLRERDRIGRERYGVPLEVRATRQAAAAFETEAARLRYLMAVSLALALEGA